MSKKKKMAISIVMALALVFNISITLNGLDGKTIGNDVDLGKLRVSLFKSAYGYTTDCRGRCWMVLDNFCCGPWSYHCIYAPGNLCCFI